MSTQTPTYSFQHLSAISVAYLLLPNLVFLVGWIRWEVMVPVVGCLLLSYLSFCKESVAAPPQNSPTRRQLFLLALLAICWAWLAGIGGFAWQRADFIKHDLIFHDLIRQSWPVVYGEGGQIESFLNYYVGWYMIPALLGKMGGMLAADIGSLLWSAVGIWLSWRWWQRFTELPLWLAVLGFALFGGMDMLEIGFNAAYEWLAYDQLKWIRIAPIEGHLPAVWGLGHRIPAAFHQLSWTPQHALGGWIATGLIWESWQSSDNRQIGWIWALVLLHSPLVAIGLVPFVLLVLLKGPLRTLLSWQNLLAGLFLTTIMGSYFLAHASLDDKGWIWQTASDPNWWWLLAVFLLFEFGGLVGILLWINRKHHLLTAWLPLLWTALISLIGLSLFRLGYYNDLFMRASIPAMMVIGSMAFKILYTNLPRLYIRIILFVLLIGSLAPAQEQLKSLYYTLTQVPDFRIRPVPSHRDIRSVDEAYQEAGIPHPFELAPQYLGEKESWFGTTLLARPAGRSPSQQ